MTSSWRGEGRTRRHRNIVPPRCGTCLCRSFRLPVPLVGKALHFQVDGTGRTQTGKNTRFRAGCLEIAFTTVFA